jgi:hypothetical protein
MSQLTRAEAAALIKKAGEHRRRIRELQDALDAIMNRLALRQQKPERRKAVARKK